MTNISDPIRIEHALAVHERMQKDIKKLTDGFDAFIQQIKDCDKKIAENQ